MSNWHYNTQNHSILKSEYIALLKAFFALKDQTIKEIFFLLRMLFWMSVYIRPKIRPLHEMIRSVFEGNFWVRKKVQKLFAKKRRSRLRLILLLIRFNSRGPTFRKMSVIIILSYSSLIRRCYKLGRVLYLFLSACKPIQSLKLFEKIGLKKDWPIYESKNSIDCKWKEICLCVSLFTFFPQVSLLEK